MSDDLVQSAVIVEYNVANRLHLLTFFPMNSTLSNLCQSPKPPASASIASPSGSSTSSRSSRCRLFLLFGDLGDFGTFFSTGGDACMAAMQYSRFCGVSSTSRHASLIDHAQFITLGSPPSKAGKVIATTFPHRYLSESTACLSFLFCSSSDISRRIFSCRTSVQVRFPNMVLATIHRQNRVSHAAMQKILFTLNSNEIRSCCMSLHHCTLISVRCFFLSSKYIHSSVNPFCGAFSLPRSKSNVHCACFPCFPPTSPNIQSSFL